jgi:hypothetical protein
MVYGSELMKILSMESIGEEEGSVGRGISRKILSVGIR